ncbi:MAG: Uma2 family endonuclease [Armatimonadota bacterium]|nr:Uma2 family endonuclease [bacterium]MDW8291124.1 Uma2 family endonuclease [Armatimonadota bacterium]
MATITERKIYTIDDLWELSHKTDKRLELVRGELRELAPASDEHGYLCVNLATIVTQFVKQHGSGYTFAAETGFVLSEDPATVRAPDFAFVSRERAPENWTRHFARYIPDLVAEVVSPSDTFSEVTEKVDDWLRAGVRLVWVVDPVQQSVRVYRADQPVRVLRAEDMLSGDDVLPGFACKVSEIFAR